MIFAPWRGCHLRSPEEIHQTMDAVSILKPVTKFSATVGTPDQLSEILANACRFARVIAAEKCDFRRSFAWYKDSGVGWRLSCALTG
jgi:hypothetical protein